MFQKRKEHGLCYIFSSSFFFNPGAFSTMIENLRAIALSPTQITPMSVYEITLTEKIFGNFYPTLLFLCGQPLISEVRKHFRIQTHESTP